jgi:hypothetical protein
LKSIENGAVPSDTEDWLFLAAENLNCTLKLVDCSGIRFELVRVNLKAAKIAMGGTAFVVACTLLVFVLPTWQIVSAALQRRLCCLARQALDHLLAYYQLLNFSGDAHNLEPSSLSGEASNDEFALQIKDNKSNLLLFSVIACQIVAGYSYEKWDLLQKECDGYFTQGISHAWAGLAHYDLYRATRQRNYRREGRRAYYKIKKWVANGTGMLLGPLRLLAAMASLCATNAPLDEVDILFQRLSWLYRRASPYALKLWEMRDLQDCI